METGDEALPVSLIDGWPEPLHMARVILREAGITLGSIALTEDEWALVASSEVYSQRIDDHPHSDGWITTQPDGTTTRHQFEIPVAPVRVPASALGSSGDLAKWVWSTHGALGRLLLWDKGRAWWLVQEPDLELALVCSHDDTFGSESDVLSWWSIPAANSARDSVGQLCARYDIDLPEPDPTDNGPTRRSAPRQSRHRGLLRREKQATNEPEWWAAQLETIRSEGAARQSLLKGQEAFVGWLEATLFRHDPIAINFDTNKDEYRPEAETITLRLPEATSETDVLQLIHEEFVRWFGSDVAGRPERYAVIARETWSRWSGGAG